MRKFGIAAKLMPTLELHGQAGQVVKLEPHALWIIGNNGRVDVKRDGRRHLVPARVILAALVYRVGGELERQSRTKR